MSGAVGGGRSGIATVIGDQRQTGCEGHLDYGGAAIPHDAPLRGDGISQRSDDISSEILSAGSVNERGEGAVATVGYGNEDGFGIGDGALHAALYGHSGGACTDALFESLRGDNDSERHGPIIDHRQPAQAASHPGAVLAVLESQ